MSSSSDWSKSSKSSASSVSVSSIEVGAGVCEERKADCNWSVIAAETAAVMTSLATPLTRLHGCSVPRSNDNTDAELFSACGFLLSLCFLFGMAGRPMLESSSLDGEPFSGDGNSVRPLVKASSWSLGRSRSVL